MAIRVTPRDLELLAFVADHRLVLAAHVQELLDVSASAARARLGALSSAGLLHRERVFHQQPACYQVTRAGLAVLASELPPPNLDLRCYGHDVGLAWLWLAARGGTFGPVREVLSERQLRSRDARPDGGPEPLAVRLGGVGARGRERLHYPDLLLLLPTSTPGRVALELELTGKHRTRRETILAGYALDARIDAVLYLVNRRSVARDIRSSAARLGISSLVNVRGFTWGASREAAERAPATDKAPAMARGARAGR